jgi:plastocyanin
MIRQHTFGLALAIVAAAACGGGGSSGGAYGIGPSSNDPPPPSPNTVNVADNSFNPTAVTVSPGTTVTWKWAVCSDDGSGGYGGYGSTTCSTHNVTFDDGSGEASQSQDAGQYSRTFTAPGTYKYHCSIHGASVMSGEIVVK